MKRYIAELIGTMVLVLFGCGSAAIAGQFLGTLGIAMAFGLSIVAMAYVIGDISGCHINPAVSIGMWIDGRMEVKDLIMYIIFQCIGAIIGIALLVAIINSSAYLGGYLTTGLGQNGFGAASTVGLNVVGAIIVEIILTFVFVFTVLGVTKKTENATVAGIVIGLTLAFVHTCTNRRCSDCRFPIQSFIFRGYLNPLTFFVLNFDTSNVNITVQFIKATF